jgi:multiple sugar transport system substrate-binding protein
MKKFLVVLIAFCLCGICMNATAQTKEIRVLVANHPYGDLLKTAIPEFEGATGIKVNVESLQESQLSTKLATEFATCSCSVLYRKEKCSTGMAGWNRFPNTTFPTFPRI